MSTLPNAGDTLGAYTLGEVLGQGGCAKVYAAESTDGAQRAAIKVMLPGLAEVSPGMSQRFLREIDVVRRVDHPSVVELYDHGVSESGLLWMAMELVDGVELHDVLREEGALSLQRAHKIVERMLEGLNVAHTAEIVHRDLKPANVMLCTTHNGDNSEPDDTVKILDFGIGKAIGADEEACYADITSTFGDVVGSPHYMAPEQLKRTGVGPQSDVYSVGLMLFEMLVGSAPVKGDTIFEVYANQVYRGLSMPRWLHDSPYGPLIAKATAKDPDERYPSAKEFAGALAEIDPSIISPRDDDDEKNLELIELPGAPTPSQTAAPIPVTTGGTAQPPANGKPGTAKEQGPNTVLSVAFILAVIVALLGYIILYGC